MGLIACPDINELQIEDRTMKSRTKKLSILAVSALMTLPAAATDLSVPNSFTSGSPARAADVNANFAAVEAAVTDNDTRITANTDAVDQLSMANAVAYSPSENRAIFVDATDRVVKTLTVFAPVDGHVVISYNSWFICTTGATCTPRCSISEGGTTINTNNFTIDSVPLNGYGSLALTYGQPVDAGDTVFNVVCDTFAGSGSVGDMSMVAVFSTMDHTG